MKSINQKIIQAASSFYSDETQLIQLSYEKRPFSNSKCSPLYHNFIYALILLRTKQRTSMEEGMHLIERLLHFQIKEASFEGNFPRYIHEYPYSERKFEVVDILLPMYWIYKDFSHVLPKILKSKLLDSIYLGINYIKKLLVESGYSYMLNIQIYSLFFAYGKLFNQTNLMEQGKDKLQECLEKGSDKSWGSPRTLSKLILYLALHIDDETDMYLQPFWNFIEQVWCTQNHVYCGPGLNEHFYNDQQEKTLYHYFIDSEKSQLLDADLMEAILLPERKESKMDQISCLNYELEPFKVHQQQLETLSYSFFNLPKETWDKRGGFYPLKIFFKDLSQNLHSFILQMGGYVKIEQVHSHKLLFTFDNSSEQELDISFFGNRSKEMKIQSKKKSASMFDCSSPIEFIYSNKKITISFPEFDPNRGIWAQYLYDNRRSQMTKKVGQIQDWHLYFRKTKKNDDLPFKVLVELTN